MPRQEVIHIGRQCKNIHRYAETVIIPLVYIFFWKIKDWKMHFNMSRYETNTLRMENAGYQWWAVRIEIVYT